ncbi:hypothetical protein Q8791_11450 [Nocardiopsis sp. CT-R113]|uniref:DUF6891 domain-containing protein n=1 Tax=Nocardiopsis codii TaxID=3065942 RepID=A0ABU7K6F9_9ACTN|nr:hypothetical protein [Nocardiopsis sp. CT-R113]MEE2037834.1 hypothetical protein [Nocardiopsis sp. CT-R113]
MSEVREPDRLPRADAGEGVRARVASGRGGFVEILHHARADLLDSLEEGAGPDDPRVREALARLPDQVDAALADHRHRQRRWPSRTDGERLTRAFRALDESGIIAREDFTCCDTCGRAALDAELGVRNSEPGGAATRGYAFYHHGESLAAADGGSLYVGFESSHPVRLAAVGEEVAEVLRAHGLTVEWDGDSGRKLRVRADWSHRRWDRQAAFAGPAADGEPMVTVGIGSPGPYAVPPWITRYEGRVAVREFARMVLPWMPGGFVATLRSDHGDSAEITRDFDLLRVAGGPALSRERAEEPLGRWAVGAAWPGEDAHPSPSGLLEVTYADTAEEGAGYVDYAEPMRTAAARHLVYRLTPVKGTFAVFASRGEGVVQMMWEPGPRLWMESPSPEESLARGRHVSLPEAEEMVRVLGDEGRVALADLGGLRVTRW